MSRGVDPTCRPVTCAPPRQIPSSHATRWHGLGIPAVPASPDVVEGRLFDGPALPYGLQLHQRVMDGGQHRLHRVVGYARGVSSRLVADPEGRREGGEDGLI